MVNIAGGVHQNVKYPKIIHYLSSERDALLVFHNFLYNNVQAKTHIVAHVRLDGTTYV